MALGEDDLSRLSDAPEDALEGHELLEQARRPLAPTDVCDPIDGRKKHGLARIGDARLGDRAPEWGVASVAIGLADLVLRAGRMERHVASAEEPVVPASRVEVGDHLGLEPEARRRLRAPLGSAIV